MITIEHTCPLGGRCEEAKDGRIIRCSWYCQLIGKHPQTGEETSNWGCSMAFIPVLLVELSRQVGGLQAATESLRNHNIAGAERVVQGLAALAGKRREVIYDGA